MCKLQITVHNLTLPFYHLHITRYNLQIPTYNLHANNHTSHVSSYYYLQIRYYNALLQRNANYKSLFTI